MGDSQTQKKTDVALPSLSSGAGKFGLIASLAGAVATLIFSFLTLDQSSCRSFKCFKLRRRRRPQNQRVLVSRVANYSTAFVRSSLSRGT